MHGVCHAVQYYLALPLLRIGLLYLLSPPTQPSSCHCRQWHSDHL